LDDTSSHYTFIGNNEQESHNKKCENLLKTASFYCSKIYSPEMSCISFVKIL
jgi:hypothetical protein